MDNDKEMNDMAVMSRPVQSAFVVDPSKAERFLHKKAEPAIKERILKNSERMKRHATFSYKKQG